MDETTVHVNACQVLQAAIVTVVNQANSDSIVSIIVLWAVWTENVTNKMVPVSVWKTLQV